MCIYLSVIALIIYIHVDVATGKKINDKTCKMQQDCQAVETLVSSLHYQVCENMTGER